MADMPEMQEHFPAGASTAASRKTEYRAFETHCGYGGNAGAFSGGCIDLQHPEKRNLLHLKSPAGTPKMQEQFSAGA
jgi:hypothetical protein